MIEKMDENPQAGAMAWLLEMELVQNPYMLNSMILNVFKAVKGLKDTEFVIDTKHKRLLIFLELRKMDEWFRKEKIEGQVLEMFDQILPSFTKRVVFDRNIIEKALKIVNP